MKKFNLSQWLLVLLLAISAGLTTHAQSEKSLLWKISGNGLVEDSYLFGTIHLICPDQFMMDDRIKEAFENTDQLVMELDMDDPTMQQKMQQLSLNAGMKNLEPQIKEEYKEALNQFLMENYGASISQFGVLKPFVLSSMIMLKQLPCEQIESYELFFTNLATEQQKEILGLETVEFQMQVFDQIPIDYQLDELGKMVTEDDSQKEFAKMIEAYQAEDLDQLYKMIAESGTMTGDFAEIMLDDRNEEWIDDMENLMKEEATFFAVGAGHLGGENGVISLLEKAGYKVEAVK
ncbi:TraB/GumN family protein [Algoriphagus marincola]|uniref:TraB/GumN family protein n=1 Tax=Algoriphagus marincola TaxID=264027 RepID=A0ABS7N0E7_9BACT|nr:TraB/GumN family protein [Algoriphagus marincola]MBY5949796.1 TraB/GumN family protein [Algoriphagus marincola]